MVHDIGELLIAIAGFVLIVACALAVFAWEIVLPTIGLLWISGCLQ